MFWRFQLEFRSKDRSTLKLPPLAVPSLVSLRTTAECASLRLVGRQPFEVH